MKLKIMFSCKRLILLLALAVLASCIKPYDPMIESSVSTVYVVSGTVTDHEGWQEISVSLSSPIDQPAYIPVSGCRVDILDDAGNTFPAEESEDGYYRAWIDQQYLNPGTAYQVKVQAPDGTLLESSFDTMMACPPLDSIYYIIEDKPTYDPAVYDRGMQFYVDIDARGYQSQYFQWEVEETWEYHSPHLLENYYDGQMNTVFPPDSTLYACWEYYRVPEVFNVSTEGLTGNAYYRLPLHFVDGSTDRLSVLYSMLVKQYALSEGAYYYWEQLRVNSTREGSLYEKQPFSVRGNIRDVNDPSQEVLGYFYAGAEVERRYFYQDVQEVPLDFIDVCQDDPLGRMGWKEYSPKDYPVYYYRNQYHAIRVLSSECVDCRLRGGTLEKPDFWP